MFYGLRLYSHYFLRDELTVRDEFLVLEQQFITFSPFLLFTSNKTYALYIIQSFSYYQVRPLHAVRDQLCCKRCHCCGRYLVISILRSQVQRWRK